MKSILYVVILLILAVPQEVAAQYWGERVLEKSFEQTDFFFTPSYLIPYGIGSFKSVTPGLIKDPLSDIVINPARLWLDSLQTAYFYTDYRSAKELQEPPWGIPQPWLAMREGSLAIDRMVYFPTVYINTRRELEPVFSGAFIGRLLPTAAPDLVVGVTYQLVLQDEKYYTVPQDIYRSSVGYDYSGMRAAGAEKMPIVDKYSGKDNMNQTGQALNGFIRYAFPVGLEVGGKLSRVVFGRDGSFGSSNLWQYSYTYGGTSLWSNFESREQEYSHWDASAGLAYRASDQITIGVTGGYLWGDATQSLQNTDSSYYSASSTADPWSSYYNSSGNTLHEWRHSGKTGYLGIDLTDRLSPSSVLALFYQRQWSTVDLGLGSSILDTSYSTYSWVYDGTPGNSYSQSYLSDSRDGSGQRTRMFNRFMASLQWEVDEKVHLSIGAVVDVEETETNTSEAVLVASRSAHWSTSGAWDWRTGQDASKELVWEFTARRTSFQIPVLLTIKASRALQVLLGLNRNMSHWKIEDVTTAYFRYRVSTVNGEVKREENFGERYTTPAEEVSDVRTAFLAGLTISPSEKFNIRLLMVPNFRDSYEGSELEQLQWWIGLTLKP